MDPVLTEPGFLREKNRKIRTCLKTLQLYDPQRVQMKGIFLGWFVGLVVQVPGLFVRAQPSTKYFCPHRKLFRFICPPPPSKLGRQSCWVACLFSMCPWFIHSPVCRNTFDIPCSNSCRIKKNPVEVEPVYRNVYNIYLVGFSSNSVKIAGFKFWLNCVINVAYCIQHVSTAVAILWKYISHQLEHYSSAQAVNSAPLSLLNYRMALGVTTGRL